MRLVRVGCGLLLSMFILAPLAGEQGALTVHRHSLLTNEEKPADAIGDAIAQCFNAAYTEKSVLRPFKAPVGEGKWYEVTCGQGNGFSADNKSQPFTYPAQINHQIESFVFVETSRTDRGWYTPPKLVHGKSAVRVILGCNGHKSLGSEREWSKGYITGELRYLPTDDEQREMIDKCINQQLGGEE